MRIIKIISGGQTGCDTAALDAAIYCNLSHGGWCPKNRKQEKGKKIPLLYHLTETDSTDYLKRTEANTIDSDSTIIFFYGTLTGGSAKTALLCTKHKKPYYCFDLESTSKERIITLTKDWFNGVLVETMPPQNCVLNVAGTRESEAPRIKKTVMALMVDIILAVNGRDSIRFT